MAIAPNGTVVPCQSWLDEDASLGSLLTLTFDEIWNNPDAIELRFMSEDEALSCPFRTGKEKKNEQ
jgi:radical SAM protein with 4Fe4S-binding SPASM domain